ncbi:hypothetical protein B4U79_03288 [Dinothrombium tinctorium]|uniref:Uncharacterized protein n=1 Tax=Dinothrombium tinctorium TaxID=1965070 RepID=A0A3S3R087_9ACAR|nr:hypothetical protein B4U79_10062 [Dinothrombium tinctorium]RWS16614.1 hypothetical protein B4U79_06647 [Dinothrombium tinctorium]RWS17421.1 hypothetical protein B4U79_03288 [Dinothrombium tinctorium]
MTLRQGSPFSLPSFLDSQDTYICCAYSPRCFVIQKVGVTLFSACLPQKSMASSLISFSTTFRNFFLTFSALCLSA